MLRGRSLVDAIKSESPAVRFPDGYRVELIEYR
jgi:hypothetical protein